MTRRRNGKLLKLTKADREKRQQRNQRTGRNERVFAKKKVVPGGSASDNDNKRRGNRE